MQSFSLNSSEREENTRHTYSDEAESCGNASSESKTSETITLARNYESTSEERDETPPSSDSPSTHDIDEEDIDMKNDTDNLLSKSERLEVKEQCTNQYNLKKTLNKKLSYKIKRLLIHGSFYAIGLCILIVGGVSSRFHPYVDPEEYSNCTSFDNSSYASGDSYSNA